MHTALQIEWILIDTKVTGWSMKTRLNEQVVEVILMYLSVY